MPPELEGGASSSPPRRFGAGFRGWDAFPSALGDSYSTGTCGVGSRADRRRGFGARNRVSSRRTPSPGPAHPVGDPTSCVMAASNPRALLVPPGPAFHSSAHPREAHHLYPPFIGGGPHSSLRTTLRNVEGRGSIATCPDSSFACRDTSSLRASRAPFRSAGFVRFVFPQPIRYSGSTPRTDAVAIPHGGIDAKSRHHVRP